ncbi:MAG: alpha/beta hydrolase [Clostridia bacterium]|nr:alpha/beta hydrolase [Clostridia bacterium]
MRTRNVNIHSNDKDSVLNVIIYEPEETEIKGVIQVVHGMTEHMGRYIDFAGYFTSKGFAVIGNDIVSHGKSVHSKTEALYMSSWYDAVNDINTVRELIEKEYPGTPIYLLGFSLGSFLARSLDSLKAYKAQILVGTGNKPAAVLKMLGLYLGRKYKNAMEKACSEINSMAFDNYNSKFKENGECYWLLTNPDMRDEYLRDELVKREFSPQFFCEFLKGMIHTGRKLRNPGNIIPTLFIYGDKDPVGDFGKSVTGVFECYKKHNPDTKIIKIENYTHDVLHDDCRMSVYKSIENFLR